LRAPFGATIVVSSFIPDPRTRHAADP
jgi:hypothetical protein